MTREFYMKVSHFQAERALGLHLLLHPKVWKEPGVEENQEISLCGNKEHLIAMKVAIL